MARVHTVTKILHFSFYFAIILCCFTNNASANRELDEDNWREILEGEWLVEFYAPWCPACNALAPAWRELSSRAARKSLAMKTAAVDVTKSPGLSGRFVVTALPTIFHVKSGEFRQYKGPRDVDSMLSYVEQEKWKQAEPVPSWKAPHSLQMSLVAEFFKLSQALRSVHNMLMETYGLPTWGSYLIFAIATIFIGAVLGLILVCIIDLLYPPRRSEKVLVTQADLDRRAKGDQEKKSDDDQELINDDIVDEEDNANSDAEKNSPSDTSEDEKEKPAEGGGDSKPGEGKQNTEVRKRRPRKAD
ncbi:thioredoxin-related transmembrane protein 1 [Manduca sexta]|uniref:thioredoxin-related transmembrane protein 1 n=1 Tax=Manduca sexta TaxID=7130 RepID=UPI0011828DAA|nr:thioredoxin-related transmembrane protein 1 [Manduca sexta]